MSKYGFQYYQDNKYVPKHITVDIGGQTTVKTGGVLSSRQVIDVVDETGKKIRGFFTQNEYIDAKQLFLSRASQLKVPEGYEKLGDAAKSIAEKCASLPHGFANFVGAVYKVTGIDFGGEMTPHQEADFKRRLPNIKKLLTEKFDVAPEALDALGTDDKVDDYVKGLLKAGFAGYSLESTHTEHQLQEKNTNINRRNNAMSDVAEILGTPEIIAKSTSMTVISGDKIMHGSFMAGAQGISLNQLMYETNPNGFRDISLTPSALKEISNLQVLDFLCANIDRHLENMFYKVDDSDPYELKITGVQGIDNDASFGKIGKDVSEKGLLFDRMSLADDIKIMDEKTALEITGLSFEKLGEKLRLAGLSREELSAAGERLTLLKEKLANGSIRVIRGEKEWKRLVNNSHRMDELKTRSENVSLLNSKLPANHPFRSMQNIYGLMGSMMRNYLHPGRQAAQGNGLKGTVPVGTAVNIRDSHGIDDHLDGLRHIQDEYTQILASGGVPEKFAPVREKLGQVITLLQKYAPNDRLTDNQRNLLSESLGDLGKAAGQYAAETVPDLKNAEYHCAKNIAAYAAFAREAIRKDALEAEMNLASKGADDIRREHGIAPTAVTYERLKSRVPTISGRSTDFFKRMMSAFERGGGFTPATRTSEKKRVYDEMIKTAAEYLRHKIPDGGTDGLKPKEIERVRFARDLAEYAGAQKQLMREQELRRVEAAKERTDYTEISEVHEKFARLCENYRRAADGDEKRRATDDILKAKKDFIAGYEKILSVSDAYAPRHDMQAACGALLSAGMADYMKVCLKCYNDRTLLNETDPCAAVGMDAALKARGDTVIANGKSIMDAHKTNAAAKNSAPAGTSKDGEAILSENGQPVI